MKTLARSCLSLVATALLVTAAHAASDYKVVSRIVIGGDKSSYDYLRVDPPSHRLYVAHEKRFEVVDLNTGKKIGEIGPTARAHGIAIAPGTGHAFASSGIDDQITMFDPETLK